MMKLNVGFTQKVGDPNFGSRGASVNLELELDSGLVGDADRLKDRIRQLFTLAKASVAEQLGEPPTDRGHSDGSYPSDCGSPTNGYANGNGTGHRNGHGRPRETGRSATASQARAIYAIAGRQGVELADKLRADFGVDTPEQLTIREASRLIDELNGKDGREPVGGRR